MDYTGKNLDVVDSGGEVNYNLQTWFENPPERPPPTTTIQQNYNPPPGIIERNRDFAYALAAAPNVLYSRFKQYGELGVLAWCSEFGEMVNHLKELGIEGNMFVQTRGTALQACEEILKLHLQIKMQIIVLYLSSQVARVRKFLAGDTEFNDYPAANFPVEPSQYNVN